MISGFLSISICESILCSSPLVFGQVNNKELVYTKIQKQSLIVSGVARGGGGGGGGGAKGAIAPPFFKEKVLGIEQSVTS